MIIIKIITLLHEKFKQKNSFFLILLKKLIIALNV